MCEFALIRRIFRVTEVDLALTLTFAAIGAAGCDPSSLSLPLQVFKGSLPAILRAQLVVLQPVRFAQ
jgi:hypothetical protein